MRLVTIGPSPNLLTAGGKIHSWIIQNFYHQNYEIASLVHTHDTSFFVPDETPTGMMYSYKFGDNKEHVVPIFPFKKGGEPPNKTEAVQIYETLEKLAPDLVISVDDYESALYMQAVKMFLPDKFKWLFIPLNGSLPLNEKSRSLVEHCDAILCTNRFTFDHINDFYTHPCMDWQYVGADHSKFYHKEEKYDGFGIFCSCKNSLKDCPGAVLEACQKAKDKIPELTLDLHINLHDTGFYNFDVLQDRFDPKMEFLRLPEEYTSINDGRSDKELNDLLNKNHFFASSSILSSSSIGLFEAMATGCIPIVNDQGSDAEILRDLEENIKEKGNFTYGSVPVLMSGEKYLQMPRVDLMVKKIVEAKDFLKEKKKYQGLINDICEYSKGYSHFNFVNKISDLAKEIVANETKVFSVT